MNTATFLTSSCRCCRYYQSQGRRGGTCEQLGVPVQSQWKACALAAHPFTSTWEDLEEVVRLEKSLTLTCSGKSLTVEPDEAVSGTLKSGSCTPRQPAAALHLKQPAIV